MDRTQAVYDTTPASELPVFPTLFNSQGEAPDNSKRDATLAMELTVMKTHLIRRTICLLMLASGLIAGCDAGFVREEAQRSFATFLSGVVTTAINETINPQD